MTQDETAGQGKSPLIGKRFLRGTIELKIAKPFQICPGYPRISFLLPFGSSDRSDVTQVGFSHA